jgi:23S rRNA (guanosine2251-2'-O)-methyltransferase
MELLKAGIRKVDEVGVGPSGDAQIESLARQRGILVSRNHSKVAYSGANRNSDVWARAEAVRTKSLSDIRSATGIVLLLDHITDPHNLGAILRSAAAAEVDAVVLPVDRQVRVTPVVSKVASGALEYLEFVPVVNLARAIDALKKVGYWVIGLDERGDSTIYDFDFTSGQCAIVAGSEDTGLSRLVREKCDLLCRIPTGPLASLNVSVATAIALFEAKRARNSGG